MCGSGCDEQCTFSKVENLSDLSFLYILKYNKFWIEISHASTVQHYLHLSFLFGIFMKLTNVDFKIFKKKMATIELVVSLPLTGIVFRQTTTGERLVAVWWISGTRQRQTHGVVARKTHGNVTSQVFQNFENSKKSKTF